MARLTDHSKLEKIKQSAMLYRFFKSKEELTLNLLNSKIEDIANHVENSLKQSSSFKEIISFIITDIFKIAENSHTDIKFMYVMMNDYNFSVHSDLKERITGLIKEAYKIGKDTNQADPRLNLEDIFIFTVVYPIQFINLRLKNFFGNKTWTQEDIDNIIDICIKTLKADTL